MIFAKLKFSSWRNSSSWGAYDKFEVLNLDTKGRIHMHFMANLGKRSQYLPPRRVQTLTKLTM